MIDGMISGAVLLISLSIVQGLSRNVLSGNTVTQSWANFVNSLGIMGGNSGGTNGGY
jgi:hypothetical protein